VPTSASISSLRSDWYRYSNSTSAAQLAGGLEDAQGKRVGRQQFVDALALDEARDVVVADILEVLASDQAVGIEIGQPHSAVAVGEGQSRTPGAAGHAAAHDLGDERLAHARIMTIEFAIEARPQPRTASRLGEARHESELDVAVGEQRTIATAEQVTQHQPAVEIDLPCHHVAGRREPDPMLDVIERLAMPSGSINQPWP
jgi:hypothetical protein